MKFRYAVTMSCGLWATIHAGVARASVGTLLFPPIFGPPDACMFANSGASPPGNPLPMYEPIPSAYSYALGGSGGGSLHPLSTYPVYLIFDGTYWTSNGSPTTTTLNIINAVQSTLSSSSPYLSGIVQYGSSGRASWGGYWIDTSTDPLTWNDGTGAGPVWYEINRALTAYPSWAPASGTTDASGSPIYVEIHYYTGNHGTTIAASDGSNDFTGPNSLGSPHCLGAKNTCNNAYVTLPVNAIDVSVNYADAPGTDSVVPRVISHELAERMSFGIGASTTCGNNVQIADGEPDVIANYIMPIGPSTTGFVQAYWSVMDQAYIIPQVTVPNGNSDTNARVMLTNDGNATDFYSLRQGQLSRFGIQVNGVHSGVIDTNVSAYTIDASQNLYELTSNGQVRQYSLGSFNGSGWSGSWTSLTGTNTVASQIVAPRAPNPCGIRGAPIGGSLYMLASNNGANPQIWSYVSGTTWTPLTGTQNIVAPNGLVAIESGQCNGGTPAPVTNLYMLAESGAQSFVYQWTPGQATWDPITGSNTLVSNIVTANNNLYMTAYSGGGGVGTLVWQYSGSPTNPTNWTPLLPFSWTVTRPIWVAGNTLFAVANANTGQGDQLWQYVPPLPGATPSLNNWTAVTGTNTSLGSFAVQDGLELFMMANNGAGNQVWEFQGIGSQTNSTFGWWPLSSTSAFSVNSIDISLADVLQMQASQNGGAPTLFNYGGTPNSWVPAN